MAYYGAVAAGLLLAYGFQMNNTRFIYGGLIVGAVGMMRWVPGNPPGALGSQRDAPLDP